MSQERIRSYLISGHIIVELSRYLPVTQETIDLDVKNQTYWVKLGLGGGINFTQCHRVVVFAFFKHLFSLRTTVERANVNHSLLHHIYTRDWSVFFNLIFIFTLLIQTYYLQDVKKLLRCDFIQTRSVLWYSFCLNSFVLERCRNVNLYTEFQFDTLDSRCGTNLTPYRAWCYLTCC